MNLRKHELIGREVEVVGASDPSIVGTRGRVVDETRNMLRIDCGGGAEKSVPKRGSRFRFAAVGGRVDVAGDDILYRPEDRIKKAR